MNTARKTSYNLIGAMLVAQTLQGKLKPFCKPGKCKIAGSIRRKKDMVHDVEIVCIPKRGKVTPPGEMLPVDDQNLVVDYLERYPVLYPKVKGGQRYWRVHFMSMPCDIFMTNEQQWGRILALRTGPGSFSKQMASRWCEKRYKGHNGELVSLSGNRFKPSFPTEQSFFEFLGWDYLEPENRQ